LSEKISLATVYNTVHAFKKKGYLKKFQSIVIKSYFDTNTSVHHHFYDEDTNELIDCDENTIDTVNVKNNITGKKINSVEVLIKVASDTQNQN
jgi:Fur family iron response transcriptional regulator